MRGYRMQMNTCSAAACSGSFRAPMTSFLLIIAGIALAVSVLFIIPASIRLCSLALVLVCLIVGIIPLVSILRMGTQSRK